MCALLVFWETAKLLSKVAVSFIPHWLFQSFSFLLICWVKIATNCCFHLHPQDYEQGRLSEILPAVTHAGGWPQLQRSDSTVGSPVLAGTFAVVVLQTVSHKAQRGVRVKSSTPHKRPAQYTMLRKPSSIA